MRYGCCLIFTRNTHMPILLNATKPTCTNLRKIHIHTAVCVCLERMSFGKFGQKSHPNRHSIPEKSVKCNYYRFQNHAHKKAHRSNSMANLYLTTVHICLFILFWQLPIDIHITLYGIYDSFTLKIRLFVYLIVFIHFSLPLFLVLLWNRIRDGATTI